MQRLLALSLAFVFPVAPLSAQKLKEVHGLLQSLDVNKGVIVVVPARAQAPKGFNLLQRDLPVTHALGHPLKLADLRPGQRVLLRVDEEQETVASVRLDTDCQWGYVRGIDLDKKLLAVRLGHMPHTIAVTPEIRIERDGEPADLGDLKEGQAIVATFAPDHRRVLHVRAGRGTVGANPYTAAANVGGMLTAIDHAKKRLRLIASDRYELLDLGFDNWSTVHLVHSSYVLREIDIRELTAPCRVSLYYDRDTKSATALHADVPRLVRRVAEKFDRATRQLVIRGDDDDPTETFVIAADARIMHGQQPATLDAVHAGAIVTAGLTLDGKEIIFLAVAEK
jgi:hypothetical protein